MPRSNHTSELLFDPDIERTERANRTAKRKIDLIFKFSNPKIAKNNFKIPGTKKNFFCCPV